MQTLSPAQIEIARYALAAHDNPAQPLTGADGFPLIGSVERAAFIIEAMRPLVEAFPTDDDDEDEDSDACTECGADLSGTSYVISNAHLPSCSLHTDNVYPRA